MRFKPCILCLCIIDVIEMHPDFTVFPALTHFPTLPVCWLCSGCSLSLKNKAAPAPSQAGSRERSERSHQGAGSKSRFITVISALFLCNCGKLLATHSFISSRHLVRVVGQVFVG